MRSHLFAKWALLSILFFVLIAIVGLPIITTHTQPIHWQRQQFLIIEQKLSYFNLICNRIPPSEPVDNQGVPYCGAMKLCEALVGQDMYGFHKDSIFRADGMDQNDVKHLYGGSLINNNNNRVYPWKGRLANIQSLKEIFGDKNTQPFISSSLVVCDVYKRELPNGMDISMPILYYKATKTCNLYDMNDIARAFNYADNYNLLSLGIPWDTSIEHPIYVKPEMVYQIMWEKAHIKPGESIVPSSYALISAGHDGIYGTPDDECFLKREY